LLAAPSPTTACGFPGSRDFHDISTGNDATPLWIPQLTMALGTVVFHRIRRRVRPRMARRADCEMPDEALHNE
jgi:hypothetical protein